MNNRQIVILSLTALLLTAAGAAYAGDIYSKASARTKSLYADDTARGIGDSLTILINERGVIKNSATRSGERKSERSLKLSGQQDINGTINDMTGKLFTLRNGLDVDIQGDAKFDGNASFDSDRSVIDSITVTVSDVMDNGNLIVIGQRRREVEGDKQVIQVSGIVRRADVSFNNTISSDRIADFTVVYRHMGLENRYTKPGWLDRIFNVIQPL